MTTSIVIPARNEAESLTVLVPKLEGVVARLKKFGKIIIYLVDDFSTDSTKETIKNFQKIYPNIRSIFLKKRSGQTGCFQAAFNQINSDYIIRLDADLQDDPKDLPLFLEKFKKGADLVIGLREERKHRRLIRLTAYIYDFFVVLLFNSPLHANSGSFVGFKTSLVKGIKFKKNDHRYLPLIALHRGAKCPKEVLVKHGRRRFGESKYNPWKKIIFGFFEVWLFFARLKSGYYVKSAIN